MLREQRHYMRSSSHNPRVEEPRLCEFPINVAHLSPKGSWAPQSKVRPVNRRGYFSPSFWVEQVENGEASKTATYLDYGLTHGFHQFWKDECEKEDRRPAGPSKYRRSLPAAAGSRTSGSAAVAGGEPATPKRDPPTGRMSLARLTKSGSTPAFWPAGSSPSASWRP